MGFRTGVRFSSAPLYDMTAVYWTLFIRMSNVLPLLFVFIIILFKLIGD